MKEKILFLVIVLFCIVCSQKRNEDLYTVGILQVNDAPTLNTTRDGFIRALEDQGLENGKNIRLQIRNAFGDIPQLQRFAQEYVAQGVHMIVALSTPSLQAALHATRSIPIIFASVANPYRAGAGESANEHLSNVSGVSSRGPISQSLAFVKRLLPDVLRIGTLWTPSELNSNYYLELARESASDLGLEIIAVPIASASEVLLSAQVLINKRIDAIYQISDNTINEAFEAIGEVANENSIPLFGGFLLSTQAGACAAMGWDFFDMGYRAGQMAIKVKEGEDLSEIPFETMDRALLYINVEAAQKQGVEFPEEILKSVDKIVVFHNENIN